MNACSSELWESGTDCQNCSLRAAALFAGLADEQFSLLHDAIQDIQLGPDQELYRVGDAGKAVYTLRSGLLKLVQYLPDGSRRIVRLLRPADLTGLEALLGQPYQHDAVALQAATLCRIPIDLVNKLGAQNPSLHQELMRRWHQALSAADTWLTEFSTGTARQRVARLLLRMADSDGTSSCALFNRKDMAAMLGITTETASRLIAEFKRNGLIRQSGPAGFSCDPKELFRVAAD